VDAAMSNDAGTLLTLAVHFAILSLFAMGGANAAVPEMHRLAVDVMRWMSDRQFADMFALAQVAPGPNVIVVTLIGYHVAGLAGAAVTTAAMCGPSCVFAFYMGRVWERFKDAPWRVAIQAGLVPISVGLVGASAAILTQAADQSWLAILLTVVAACVAYVTRWNPLWMFAIAALLGIAGLV
jgi:chromate transporter